MQEFHQVLAGFRKRSDLSQSDLARRIDLSPSYVNRLESGERKPTSRTMVLAIAHALDLRLPEIDTLLVSAGYARESEPVAEAHPLIGLVAEILDDTTVPPNQIEALRFLVEAIDRERHKGGEAPPKS